MTSLKLDFESENDLYYSLLKEEDFDFKTKDITIDVIRTEGIDVNVVCGSVLELKIATNALIKSLEVIEKSLNV